MYEFISGTVEERTPASVVIDAAGVGYALLAPIGAAFPAVGSSARVFVHLIVREDVQALYGFPSRKDRDLFRVLLRVRGVGPGMALGILSGLSPEDLAAAVVNEDLRAFTSVKGVGKKAGEQILLDLRDKAALIAELTGSSPVKSATSSASPAEASTRQDAMAALVSIGYSQKEADKAVERAIEKVAKENGVEDLETLVRVAMRG